ncbi:MAG: hypothetical protein CMI09_09190 [Oceanospirillaceae bacterium]|nr:hypothetical protein [Oceanospirillaceae bacterium]
MTDKTRAFEQGDLVASEDETLASTGQELADAVNGIKSTVNSIARDLLPDVAFTAVDISVSDSNVLGADLIAAAIQGLSHPDYYEWDDEFVWASVSTSSGQLTFSGLLPGRYYENDEAEGFIIPPTIGVAGLDFVISPGDYFEIEYAFSDDNPSPVEVSPTYADFGLGVLIFDGDFSEAKLPLWQAMNTGSATTWYDISSQNNMSYTAAFIEAQGGFPAPSQLTVNVTATHVTQGGETNAGKFIGLNAGVLRYGIEYAPDGAVYLHLFKDGALVRDNMSRDKSILLKADGQSLKLMLVGESYPNLDFNGGYNGQDVPNPGSKSITIDPNPTLPVTVESGVSAIGSRATVSHPDSVVTYKRSSARPTASEIAAGYSDGTRVMTVQDVVAIINANAGQP